MHMEEDPERLSVEIHVDEPAAFEPLIRCLPPERECQFDIEKNAKELLARFARSAALQTGPLGPLEFLVLTISTHTHAKIAQADQVRQLALADMPCARRLPHIPYYTMEPAFDVEQASCDPEWRVYGIVIGDELRAFATCKFAVGKIWEITNICTHPEHRQKGYGKAVLSYACQQLFEMGLAPLYHVRSNNTASIRTALAAGFAEHNRLYRYIATTP